jgi:hypothetical protein
MLDTVFFRQEKNIPPMDPVIITFSLFGITSSRLAFWLITCIAVHRDSFHFLSTPKNFVSSFVVLVKKKETLEIPL